MGARTLGHDSDLENAITRSPGNDPIFHQPVIPSTAVHCLHLTPPSNRHSRMFDDMAKLAEISRYVQDLVSSWENVSLAVRSHYK